ncbi:RNA directed DNA polymerase (reverse transcriptase) [Echinococcus multilocularis]|uniref:RNA directed DNA polymerase (Reverse transcriptase) n=1 Tax=Echinococcus multilocularis TaxID=6211 RepID=A0A0S4MIN8_ECHMU|nr:RNA directed DNA polymerase (reverse transcriptase) [Echinococcus multilocularis]
MSKANQPDLSRNARNREVETNESRSTLVAVPAALPPFEEVGAGITHDTDVDRCCDTWTRAKILSSSTQLRSAEGREMLVDGETSLKVCIGKETWTVEFIVCLELAWDVTLGADFLRNTKAVLNFAKGIFFTHKATGASTDTSPPKDDADDICNALFKAAAIPMNNLDDLCAQLTRISNYERKELRQLLLKYANIFSWQGVRLGRTNIVKHKIDTGEARPIWQPPRCIAPPLLEEVNRLVEEILRDEVIKPSKSPWASPIALVKKNAGSLANEASARYQRLM